ncbi:MAG: thioredoxin, partial [Gammaproteobacteria bacterium]|nr:thioredoxin [Gammaproteobacteria bacterium]
LQMLKAMVEKYGEEVIFLHMDQYKNPGAFKAYDVKGDPWTFVINKQGVVHFKRAGRMLYAEMDKAIELTIASGERI